MQSSRSTILKRIKKALATPVPLPFPATQSTEQIYPAPHDDLSVLFAETFTGLLGKFSYCENDANLVAVLKSTIQAKGWQEVYCAEQEIRAMLLQHGFDNFSQKELAASDVAITSCELLVARTGSIVLSAALPEGRTASVYAPVHICIARSTQVVYDIADAFHVLRNKYGSNIPSMISFATGPSRTADIEKTLVVGVHGPKEVYCLMADR